MKPHKPHSVPDRIPAALALQSSQHNAAAVATSHSPETDQSAGTGEDEARELKEPQVVRKQKQQEGKASPTPVFVPIVVAMDAQDHKVMVEEWYSRHMVSIFLRDQSPAILSRKQMTNGRPNSKKQRTAKEQEETNLLTVHSLALRLLILHVLAPRVLEVHVASWSRKPKRQTCRVVQLMTRHVTKCDTVT